MTPPSPGWPKSTASCPTSRVAGAAGNEAERRRALGERDLRIHAVCAGDHDGVLAHAAQHAVERLGLARTGRGGGLGRRWRRLSAVFRHGGTGSRAGGTELVLDLAEPLGVAALQRGQDVGGAGGPRLGPRCRPRR